MCSEEKYKEWAEYFDELERRGIGYSLSDMKRKANELGLPIPVSVVKDFVKRNKI